MGLTNGKTRYYYVVTNANINGLKYKSNRSNIVEATTKKNLLNNYSNFTIDYYNNINDTDNSNNNPVFNYPSNDNYYSSEEQKARTIAKNIANSITGSSDLEKVRKAAQVVYNYYKQGTYNTTSKYHNTPYGVFVDKKSSCAGTARALGLVLEYLGYNWKHQNENKWTHQWVVVTIDGKTGWADGMLGMTEYGSFPF